MELSGSGSRVSSDNKRHKDSSDDGHQVVFEQTQEEIDRLCKQEIDNLFNESDDDDDMMMPDSPLFNRLRQKERCELLHTNQSKMNSKNSQAVVDSMWAVDVMNQGLDMWSIPNDRHGNNNKSKNLFMQEYQYSGQDVVKNGQDEIEIDCTTENVHHWTHHHHHHHEHHRNLGMAARSFEDPPAHICELLKFLDDDDFIDM